MEHRRHAAHQSGRSHSVPLSRSALKATSATPPPASSSRPPRDRVVAACAVAIIAAAAVGYLNSFHGPFVFDDVESITTNPTIRHLGTALTPPPGSGMTVGGRPVVNLTLALNYAAGGLSVTGYHLVNLLIHVVNALMLFGVIRRTLSAPTVAGRFRPVATAMAVLVAIAWAAHPLTTAAVTYVVQRAEALVALFYLLTLYSFIRSLESPRSRGWQAAAAGACLLGMATKEVMVSAPLLVLLYDRTFAAGSFRAALHQRKSLYAALAATWIPLLALVATTANRGGSAGFGTAVSPIAYAVTQLGAIGHYVRLVVWPHPLVFDYGVHLASGVGEVLPGAIVVGALIAATVWAFRRQSPLGFLGVLFFAVLAPSSSIVPVVTQTVAEHRMYLPLGAVILAAALAGYALLGRTAYVAGALIACAFAALTARRNDDYRTVLSIWSDTVAKLPTNGRAHVGVGVALTESGHPEQALAQLETALRLNPNDPTAHTNYGRALAELGRYPEAIAEDERSLALRPNHLATLNNYGNVLASTGRLDEAKAQLERAVLGAPQDADAHGNLGNVLLQLGRRRTPVDRGLIHQAVAEYETALRLDPTQSKAHVNLGVALEQLGRVDEAMQHYRSAIALDANNADAHNNLGSVMAAQGRLPEAKAEFEQAIAANPRNAQAHFNLSNVFTQLGQLPRAIAELQETIRLQPDYRDAYFNLGNALSQVGRGAEAIAAYEHAAQLAPDDPEVHNNLGVAYAEAGRVNDAVREFEATLRLKPDHADARRNLMLANRARTGSAR
jgi:protein O-mannosyl-transferase